MDQTYLLLPRYQESAKDNPHNPFKDTDICLTELHPNASSEIIAGIR